MANSNDRGLYARSFVDVYDDWYGDLHSVGEIVVAWQDRVEPPATILELGSGTGRIAAPLTQAGFSVIALDRATTMLERDRSASWRCAADMAALPLVDRSVDGAVIAYNTLFNLANIELQQRCLNETARVLRPGGLLAVEAFIAPDQEPNDCFGMSIGPHPTEADRRLAILTWRNPDDDVITGAHVELGSNGSRSRPWKLAYQSPAALDSAAADAGLRLIERHRDWAGNSFEPGGDRHVSWYRSL